jgi:hypothetical protein
MVESRKTAYRLASDGNTPRAYAAIERRCAPSDWCEQGAAHATSVRAERRLPNVGARAPAQTVSSAAVVRVR